MGLLSSVTLDLSSLALSQRTKTCYGIRETPKLWEGAKDKTLTYFVFQIDSDEYSLRQTN